MYLAYIDESGDNGWENSPSKFFVLGCLLVNKADWLFNLDALVSLRRKLKDRWGINPRAELKAKHLRWGTGPLEGLEIGLRDRMNIYKDNMEYQVSSMKIVNFAIAVEKSKIQHKDKDARYWAWTFLLQRIDKFCCSNKGKDKRSVIYPDEGHTLFIRRLLRQMRRIHTISGHYGGKLEIPTRLIVEDPSERKSHESYFVQVADWNAYAARRYPDIEPKKKVRKDLWDKLATTRLLDVNTNRVGPPGIVKWP